GWQIPDYFDILNLLQCFCIFNLFDLSRHLMPARDIYHDVVRNALMKDGWTITHDPLRLEWGGKDMYVDLGAENLLAVEKDAQKLAVEIKSFVGASDMADLEKALGQYVLYHDVLAELEPERVLYLAVPQTVVQNIFEEPLGRLLLRNKRLQIIGFEPIKQEVVQWIR
ncbi:MAG: XisH family protein, partial [Caldilineaceae bacterium]|nr:XisH family protein [Caldilineaceae bacterium]